MKFKTSKSKNISGNNGLRVQCIIVSTLHETNLLSAELQHFPKISILLPLIGEQTTKSKELSQGTARGEKLLPKGL